MSVIFYRFQLILPESGLLMLCVVAYMSPSSFGLAYSNGQCARCTALTRCLS